MSRQKPWLPWLLASLPALVAVGLFFGLRPFPAFTEAVFATGIFPVLSAIVGWPLSWLPFSLTEALAVLALPALIGLGVWWGVRRRRRHDTRAALRRLLKGGVWTLSLLMLTYMLLHGVNFYRQPAATLLALDTAPKDAQTLQAVCIDLAEKASAAREELPEDEHGVAAFTDTLSATLARVGEGYDLLDDRYPFLAGAVNRVKPVQLSHWWSYTGITGMYFPFFGEANVNIDTPVFAIPATAAHELAHTRGFAREDECNFFACLSCFVHPAAEYRYSGYVLAYIHCANALYAYDETLWEAAYAHCSEGMRRDLRAQNAYWDGFRGPVRDASTSVNNGFIQSQGDEDGVLSYGRVVELLLAYYEREGILENP